jgi:DNA-binding GntR family transcriptional regulator
MQRHFHTKALARRTIHDHAAILAAIVARDADAARAAMHQHLDRVVREFQRGVNDKPGMTEMRVEKRAAAAARKRGLRALARA